jgi:hypothetical protein
MVSDRVLVVGKSMKHFPSRAVPDSWLRRMTLQKIGPMVDSGAEYGCSELEYRRGMRTRPKCWEFPSLPLFKLLADIAEHFSRTVADMIQHAVHFRFRIQRSS